MSGLKKLTILMVLLNTLLSKHMAIIGHWSWTACNTSYAY